jgi:hypothetical protein
LLLQHFEQVFHRKYLLSCPLLNRYVFNVRT